MLDDLWKTEVKHGKQIHLFNLRGNDFGNAEKSSKLISGQHQSKKSFGPAMQASLQKMNQ